MAVRTMDAPDADFSRLLYDFAPLKAIPKTGTPSEQVEAGESVSGNTFTLDSDSVAAGNHVFEGGDGFDVLKLMGSEASTTISHTLSDNTLVSIDYLEISDPGIGSTREVFLSGDQFGVGISLTAEINVDGWGDSYEKIYIQMGSQASLDLSNLWFSGTVSTLSLFVTGASVADFIVGTRLNDTINGNGGDDAIWGGVGYDTLNGGSGQDIIEGGRNGDTLDGGEGVDILSYAGSNSSVVVDLESETSSGGDSEGDVYVGFESVLGTGYDDELSGDSGSNVLWGGNGADTLTGRGGVDALMGQGGRDLLNHAGFILGEGDDDVGEVFDGGDDDDWLLLGGLGSLEHALDNDTLVSIESVVFGAGNTTGTRTLRLNADQFGAGISSTAEFILDSHANTQEITRVAMGNITFLTLAGMTVFDANDAYTHTFLISGDSSDETIIGSQGGDFIHGGEGDDVLEGGAGADTLDGGGGQDVLSYFTSSTSVNINLETGVASGGDADGDVIIGGTFAGLIGSLHADILTGDAQNNFMFSSGGGDAMDGGAGSDWVLYLRATMGVTVELDDPSENTGAANGDTYTSIENVQGTAFDDYLGGDEAANQLKGDAGHDSLYGHGGNDILLGGIGNDILFGGQGEDSLLGDHGDDTLSGGSGGDDLNGGEGDDWASYFGALAGVRADLLSAAANTGEAEGDSYTLIENLIGSDYDDMLFGDNGANTLVGHGGIDQLFGRSGDDQLFGNYGDDLLSGEDGNDRLSGGQGADTLIGGSGNDTALYTQAASALRADLFYVAANSGDATGDTYSSIENLVGTAFNDLLLGDNNANSLWGGAGHDTVYGRDGDDHLFGGLGNDTLSGNMGNDSLNGGLGADALIGG
ncbi:calcium-binding protein, partial [Falsihalocynthiibacter sp. CO-5D18]